MWPGLYKTRENARNISMEIEKLLRNHNSLRKKEIANYKEQLLAETEEAIATISGQIRELSRNMESHRKQLEAKAVFLKRHNKRI